ncbi:TnsA endonuclease N-terminal domain-containing protein, partial [Oceanobacillus sp. APA_J-5(13-2)]
MMSEKEFEQWARKLNLTDEAKNEIQRVRKSPPARRLGGGRHNVSGRYSSKKMGVTIQFESHKVELPAIYMMEFNDNVLEYYDQPPRIKIYYYHSKMNNKKMAYLKTADYFVIEKDRAYWVEWKTEEELIRKSQENPERFFKENSQWVFSPGKNYAKEFNLDFLLRSSAEINWKLQRNLEFLEDYIIKEYIPSRPRILRIEELILANPGLTLLELIQQADTHFSADNVYALIAQNRIYIDLYNDVITEPENVKLYLNKEQCQGFSIIEKSIRKRTKTNKIELKSGNRILWGDTSWIILNYDQSNKKVFLLSINDNKTVELPIEIFESYISEGYIHGIDNEKIDKNNKLKKMISEASEKDLKVANQKYEIVLKYLNGLEPELNVTERTLRNWIKKYKDAEKIYGSGYLGLLPKTKQRGNRGSRLSNETKNLMDSMISESYETIKLKTAKAVYREFLVKCCNRQVELSSFSQLTLNRFPQLRFNTCFLKQSTSVLHSDAVL